MAESEASILNSIGGLLWENALKQSDVTQFELIQQLLYNLRGSVGVHPIFIDSVLRTRLHHSGKRVAQKHLCSWRDSGALGRDQGASSSTPHSDLQQISL